MTSRRNFLALLGGAGAAASSGMTPKQAAETLGVDVNGIGPTGEVRETVPDSPSVRPFSLTSHIYRRLENDRSFGQGYLPTHINTKKSWSPAFKSHVAQREHEIMHAVIEKIERDEAFASKVLAIMGVQE